MSRKAINLNYFLGLLMVIPITMIWINPGINRFIVSSSDKETISYDLTYIEIAGLSFLLAAICWWRGGLVHTPTTAFSLILLRAGTAVVALGNFAIILATLINIVSGIFTRDWGLAAGYVYMFALMFAYPVSFGGIVFIEISRLMSEIDY